MTFILYVIVSILLGISDTTGKIDFEYLEDIDAVCVVVRERF